MLRLSTTIVFFALTFSHIASAKNVCKLSVAVRDGFPSVLIFGNYYEMFQHADYGDVLLCQPNAYEGERTVIACGASYNNKGHIFNVYPDSGLVFVPGEAKYVCNYVY